SAEAALDGRQGDTDDAGVEDRDARAQDRRDERQPLHRRRQLARRLDGLVCGRPCDASSFAREAAARKTEWAPSHTRPFSRPRPNGLTAGAPDAYDGLMDNGRTRGGDGRVGVAVVAVAAIGSVVIWLLARPAGEPGGRYAGELLGVEAVLLLTCTLVL